MEIQEAKHRAKLCEWQQMVYECRGSGMPVTKWCKEHQLSVKTYYYRQRQVWKAASAQSSDTVDQRTLSPRLPAFAEVPLASSQPITPVPEKRLLSLPLIPLPINIL